MILAPSLFAADSSRYGDEILRVEQSGVEYLHIDVMDGHFVPNLSFGPNIIKGIRGKSQLYFDTHLMIENPQKYLQAFIDAGSDSITVHFEATEDLDSIRDICAENKVGFGVALRPQTPVELIKPFAKYLNILLIMSINPGFGGQMFMEESLKRIARACELREECRADYLVSVDGGINSDTARKCAGAGADILVAGTSIFGADDAALAIRSLRLDSGK